MVAPEELSRVAVLESRDSYLRETVGLQLDGLVGLVPIHLKDMERADSSWWLLRLPRPKIMEIRRKGTALGVVALLARVEVARRLAAPALAAS
jgi:hypothetical protein